MERKGWQSTFGMGMVIVLLAVGVYGCENFLSYRTTREPEVEQQIATSYRFEDIPLPPGMTLNRKESFLYEARVTKTGFLVYEGRGEMERLASFFKQQMPKHEWRLMSNFEFQNVMLIFVKEGWISVIYILPQEGDAKRIEIRVGPVETKILPS